MLATSRPGAHCRFLPRHQVLLAVSAHEQVLRVGIARDIEQNHLVGRGDVTNRWRSPVISREQVLLAGCGWRADASGRYEASYRVEPPGRPGRRHERVPLTGHLASRCFWLVAASEQPLLAGMTRHIEQNRLVGVRDITNRCPRRSPRASSCLLRCHLTSRCFLPVRLHEPVPPARYGAPYRAEPPGRCQRAESVSQGWSACGLAFGS